MRTRNPGDALDDLPSKRVDDRQPTLAQIGEEQPDRAGTTLA